MQPVAAVNLSVTRGSFRSMPGFTRLFADYCEAFERVSDFYAADYRDLQVISGRFEEVDTLGRDRSLLVETLLSQNEAWGLDDVTRSHIEVLGESSSFAVVTGQQVGILGGPLYTIYKTATAVRLASELSAVSGQAVVPVFWLEGEDHDLDEVKSVPLLRRNESVTLTYDVPPLEAGRNHGPVGRLKLTDSVAKLLDEVDEALPPTDFKVDLIGRIRDAYRPGVTMRDAFARLLKSFFPADGLVFVSPDDRRFKNPAVDLFVREVDECREIARAIGETARDLSGEYHAQLSVRPTNLFLVDDRGRFAIDARDDGGFSVRGRDRRFTRDELVSLIREDPCRISPNVVLRPILQDRILPTVAYVGGPGEVAYYAQLKPVYEWFGQPMPAIYPRASVTIVEEKVGRLLRDYGLDVAAAGENVNDLFRRVVVGQMDVDLDSEFDAAARHLHSGVNAIKPVATGVDNTMGKAVEAARAAILKEWTKLREKVLKAEKRRHDQDRLRLERLRENLYPDGRLQERNLSLLYFMNKYGPGFLDEFVASISLDTREHQVVEIESA